ncbi:MAG: NAD(P)H-hydrate epimerase [Conexivisphaerales archaeon]
MKSQEMKKIEEMAEEGGLNRLLMMENAGKAIGDLISEIYEPSFNPGILAVCGPGNNGGDCISAARHLCAKADVSAICLGTTVDAVKTEEARTQWRIAKNLCRKMKIIEVLDTNIPDTVRKMFEDSDIIIDGIFGTGIKGEIKEPYASIIKLINSSTASVISVDIPSGIDPDTGEDNGLFVRADITVTLHASKPGLSMRPDASGIIVVKDIGIPFATGQ